MARILYTNTVVDMWKTQYSKILFWVIVVGGFIIAAFALLADVGESTLVNSMQLRHGNPDYAATSRQAVLIDFNEKIDFSRDDVNLKPEVDFSLQHNNLSSEISFNEELQADTAYTFKVNGMSSIDFSFKTKPQTLLHINRLYEKDGDDQKDLLIETDLNKKKSTLFKAPKIKTFSANYNYIVVAVEKELQDEVVVIDRRTKKKTIVPLPVSLSRIDTIDIPLYGDTVAFTLDMDYTSYRKTTRSLFDRVLYLYDISDKKLTAPKRDNDYLYIDSFSYGKDVNTLLYRDVFDTYYLDNFTSKQRQKIGGYFLDGGLNNNENLVLLFNGGGITIFDRNNKNKVNITPENQILSLDFIQDDSVVFLKPGLANDSLAFVDLIMIEEGVMKVVKRFSNGGFFPTRIKVDPENSYAALESKLKECRRDNYDLHSRCKNAEIVIFDLTERKTASSLKGISPLWLP